MLEELYGLALWDSPSRLDDVEAAVLDPSVGQDQVGEAQAVGHGYGSDDSTLPPLGADLAGYLHWSSVASTIYSKLYQISEFDPSVVDYSEASFAKLRRSFSTNPYWNGQLLITSHDVPLRYRDYRPVVETIDELSKRGEVSADIAQLMVKNVKQVAELASKPNGLHQKQSLFHNATLAINAGVLRVLFMYAVVPMQMDQEKGRYRVEDEIIQIVLARGVLNLDFCKRYADRILTYGNVGVEAWISMAAANNEPENTCEGWPGDA